METTTLVTDFGIPQFSSAMSRILSCRASIVAGFCRESTVKGGVSHLQTVCAAAVHRLTSSRGKGSDDIKLFCPSQSLLQAFDEGRQSDLSTTVVGHERSQDEILTVLVCHCEANVSTLDHLLMRLARRGKESHNLRIERLP